jgi:S1-C subfamily serine protease
VSINGDPVTDSEQIDRVVIASKVGSAVKLEIIRDGRRQSISVPVVSRQQQPRIR